MYKIDIITVMPAILDSFLNHSIIKRAKTNQIVEISVFDLRDYTTLKNKQIDDYPYGGDAGMVIRPEPLAKAIETLSTKKKFDEIIYMCPDGVPLKQSQVNQLSLLNNIMIICGRYKGIDERIRDAYITKEISIGDYVISGGELAACILSDAISRILPGAIGDETSALTDSFQDRLLSPPVYTRPAIFKNLKVPDILLSGNHHLIDQWKNKQAIKKTTERRPDLL